MRWTMIKISLPGKPEGNFIVSHEKNNIYKKQSGGEHFKRCLEKSRKGKQNNGKPDFQRTFGP